jgi:hypothetical protein
MSKKAEASGAGVLSLYVIEGAVIALIVTRALALHGNGLVAGGGAVAALFFVMWGAGWPVYGRAQEYASDAEQRRAHPGSTFKGRMPPSGAMGALWKLASGTVGALFGAHRALYDKASIAFRPPLFLAWMLAGVAAVAFLPTRKGADDATTVKKVVVDETPIATALADKDPYACPQGTEKKGAPPPAGHELWCEAGGKKNGPYRKWFDDASERLQVQGGYKDGNRDGMWRKWYSSGRVAEEGAFKDGKPDGHHQAWDESGKKIEDTTFDNGVEMKK